LKSLTNVEDAYNIIIPSIPIEVVNFKFSSMVEKNLFIFHFRYANEKWNCWVTIDNEVARLVGVYPNVMNWAAYTDYSIMFVYDGDTIGLEDLILSKIAVIKWLQ
jgi:hypothetical protein